MMPILSSDQASERVRGISVLPSTTRNALDVRIATSAASRSSSAFPSNTIRPSFSMMNSASSALCLSAATNSGPAASRTAVCSATKNASRSWCVTSTELTPSRSRSLMISSSTVSGRNRIEAGRRLVVEQDARLGGHRARDRHAAALAARQLRRHPVDELAQADEAEHLGDARVRLVDRPSELLEQLVADVLADGERVEQRPFLEDHPEVGADRHQLRLRPCRRSARRSRRCARRPASAVRAPAAGSSTFPRRSRPGRSSCGRSAA